MIYIFVVVSERIPRFRAFAINIIKNGNEGMAVIILEQDNTNLQLAIFWLGSILTPVAQIKSM